MTVHYYRPQLYPRRIFYALISLIALFVFLASIVLMIVFVPKHLDTVYPKNVHCSTCEELCGKNYKLCWEVECFIPGAKEDGELTRMRGIERCWVINPGMDIWGKPTPRPTSYNRERLFAESTSSAKIVV